MGYQNSTRHPAAGDAARRRAAGTGGESGRWSSSGTGKRKKVLLLNPPGRLRYQRDCYYSLVSKGDTLFMPLDLLVQTGILNETCDVHVIDAIADGVHERRCLDMVASIDPDAVFFPTGYASLDEDLRFATMLRERKPHLLLLASGGCLLHKTGEFLETHPVLDAVVLDIFTRDIAPFVDDPRGAHRDIVSRHSGGAHGCGWTTDKQLRYPTPLHHLFPLRRYRIPHGAHHPFAKTLTSFGCPHACSFCITTAIPPYRLRPVEDVFAELDAIKALGVREVWLNDHTFGINRRHALSFCKGLAERGDRFSWTCSTRADTVDEEMASAMAEAGCHTLQIGVESGSDRILAGVSKGITSEQTRAFLRMCRRLKLRVMAHIIFGLPGETEETVRETLDMLREERPEYASFNIAVPIPGTPLGDEAVRRGWTSENLHDADQSHSYPAIPLEGLSRHRLWELVNTAYKQFYFNPSYIFRRLISIRTAYQGEVYFREGLRLLSNYLRFHALRGPR